MIGSRNWHAALNNASQRTYWMADLHRKIMGSCWRGEQHVLGLGYSNLCSGLDVVEEEKESKRLGERTFLSELGPWEWMVASHVTSPKQGAELSMERI
jgi:hypothetical protein